LPWPPSTFRPPPILFTFINHILHSSVTRESGTGESETGVGDEEKAVEAGQASLRVIRLHDARRTHASIMLKQGIHPRIVQERLGHADIAITLDTYSHISPGLQAAAAKSFDEAFTKNSGKLDFTDAETLKQ